MAYYILRPDLPKPIASELAAMWNTASGLRDEMDAYIIGEVTMTDAQVAALKLKINTTMDALDARLNEINARYPRTNR